ncbi:uncharacterized protein [Physcomitrium patens]|uniref:uncharacterized protein isoform X1 n=1 Tax=Physcomitrium patens TaxID=3218 RepID=UPI003CCD3401
MDDAQKIALVKLEVERVQRLPASSAYAIHRLKVLNKMLELLSKMRRLPSWRRCLLNLRSENQTLP